MSGTERKEAIMEQCQAQQNAPRKRRNLSGEKKYLVLEEVKCNPAKKGEILRREGLFRNDIQRYDEIVKTAGIKALSQMRPGKKRPQEVPAEQYESLKREYEIQEKALAGLTVEFMVLKKKVNLE